MNVDVNDWSRPGLELVGFRGFVPFDGLDAAEVSQGPGVYVVVRPNTGVPEFLAESPAGWFKGRNPSVSVGRLGDSWVTDVSLVYIGKAASGRTGRAGLRRRLATYRRHGAGEPVGHWGGWFIWQLADSGRLLVAWLETPGQDPEAIESYLLAEFASAHGRLPFANLKRGKVAAD